MRKNRYQADLTSHPGATLLEMLRRRDMSQSDLCRSIGVANSYMSDVCSGRRGVSVELALKLEVLGIAAEFWLALQTNHDLAAARTKRAGKAGGA